VVKEMDYEPGQQHRLFFLDRGSQQPLTFTTDWSKLAQRMLPHLKFLECSSDKWTEEGFISMMNAVSQSMTLEHFKISLPAHWVGTFEQACEALQDIFHNRKSQLNHITITNVFPPGYLVAR
jgi:hypothetical protein